MRNILASVIVAGLAWFGYTRYQAHQSRLESQPAMLAGHAQQTEPAATSSFSCDGRTHCSQMNSCAEATYFIQHCPNTKMDGNNDGVPCESQWCK